MRAALSVEALKLTRAPAARVATVVLVLVIPAVCAGMVLVARSGSDGALALKVRPMLIGTGWAAYLGLLGELMSVAALIAVGFVLSWVVGREFTDGTVGALLALPTAPGQILGAKLLVTLAWAVLSGLAAALVALPAGLAVGLGAPDSGALTATGQVLVVMALMTLLALPLAWVSTVLRGYLSGIATLLGIVVVTQIVTISGAGGWFPYAAPSLWTGMGGAEAAANVTPVQLMLAIPVGLVGAWAAAHRWRTAELV